MNWKKPFAVVVSVLALGVNPLSARDLAQGEWYLKLILKSEAEALEDSYNTLGQLADAAPGFDKYDLPELSPTWPGTYLSVIFFRPEWGTETATYNTDYHPISGNKAGDEWTFEVRSNDPARDLTLTWVGENTNMKTMVLVDLQEDVVVPAVVKGKPQVYNFRMNGTVREFAWRLLTKTEYKALVASGKEDDKARRKGKKKSDWLPVGWGQGEGKGHRHEPVPKGLPDDPFEE